MGASGIECKKGERDGDVSEEHKRYYFARQTGFDKLEEKGGGGGGGKENNMVSEEDLQYRTRPLVVGLHSTVGEMYSGWIRVVMHGPRFWARFVLPQ